MLGGLATGTRLLGLALLPALVVLLWRGRDARSLARLAPLALLPAAVGLYALYLNSTLGDPWAFTSAQADWDRDDVVARTARGTPRRPCRLPDVVRAICSNIPARGRDMRSGSRSGTFPISPCSWLPGG